MNKLFEEPILLAEVAIVLVFIITQIIVFMRNNIAIGKLKRLYPDSKLLEVKSTEVGAGVNKGFMSIGLIGENKRFSTIFREIVRATNSYLKRNKGAADSEALTDIADARDTSVERAIDSIVSLPLYLGLLCTFTGVIIGLIKISMDGVTDSAIQSFIGGVLIGMIGSATGLSLTVWSNSIFKEGKKKRDKAKYDYFSFLRSQIIPILHADEPTASKPEHSLREDLAAFQEGFVTYQKHVKESLTDTLGLLTEIKDVTNRVKNLEHGLVGVGNVLEQNDEMIDKQVAYIESYTQKAESFTRVLGDHFTTIDGKLTHLMDDSLNTLEGNMRTAYMKMDSYLGSLEGDGSKEFVDGMKRDMLAIQHEVAQLQQRSVDINDQLLKQLQGDDQINRRISQQMEAMNANLKSVLIEQQHAKVSFINSIGFKIFAITGAIAFVLAIVGGIAYSVTTFMP